ncbi:hypothetical protein FQA47_006728 [Oryzias melastigma]|uniref:Uncharacterized protein n=1 Tax=Oryzias melastigma TaxID=30732 RepID=A0A834CER4_ORYME|nr:hypothetical protein FQA47_006728 [Oryzias melastigma]
MSVRLYAQCEEVLPVHLHCPDTAPTRAPDGGGNLNAAPVTSAAYQQAAAHSRTLTHCHSDTHTHRWNDGSGEKIKSCAGACACVRVDVRATEQAGLQTHSLPAGRAVGTESCAAVLINDLKPR